MFKIILIENPLECNIALLLNFKWVFVYELYGNTYAVCNSRVSKCCLIELGSFYLLSDKIKIKKIIKNIKIAPSNRVKKEKCNNQLSVAFRTELGSYLCDEIGKNKIKIKK